ncbi:RNA polymerase ECF family sigma subunit [Fluviicoccus keumensis]|uniref:RNA polymerase ECF family sigma subunit n=1 Tax=Fluviicoccus keumensis TaxID=1435465 RepID=A0A4Q7ZAF8_9GAMM|nr:sigma-70 family RNA polymerase sigma factor [Fluviicoccus keumensis]RZU46875.1 RNA polymerase ECF family sigma subunit [Fluviicoccus keumensis]
MRTVDTAYLLSRISLGDRQAFRHFYDATSPRLYAIALGLLRRRDEAEEVLQDTYVGLWHSARTYNPERGTVQTWLNTIIRNRCIDRLRQSDRRLVQPDDESWSKIASDLPTPLHHLMTDQDSKALARCLEQLDVHQQESLALAFFEGLSHTELAGRLDTPLGTVKARIRRGLVQLRQCMQT